MSPIQGRCLHYVFKISDRKLTAKFVRDVLGMKVLRHEEFDEGCNAACNGPYDNRWSKTMVGYGDENTHFVLELTYNYGITSYKQGNDFLGITIRSKEAIENAKKHSWPITLENGLHMVQAPDGYKFYLINEPQPTDRDPIEQVALASHDLQKSISYWHNTLGLKILNKSEKEAIFAFDDNQAKLLIRDIGVAVDHGSAFGRIAFSVPKDQLTTINNIVTESQNTILTPLISLDTPGKATVTVIILADTDGHEICFVGDEAFRELSSLDPSADSLLDKSIAEDRSRDKKK